MSHVLAPRKYAEIMFQKIKRTSEVGGIRCPALQRSEELRPDFPTGSKGDHRPITRANNTRGAMRKRPGNPRFGRVAHMVLCCFRITRLWPRFVFPGLLRAPHVCRVGVAALAAIASTIRAARRASIRTAGASNVKALPCPPTRRES